MAYRDELIERIKVAAFAVRFSEGNKYNAGRLSAFKKALELYEDQDTQSGIQGQMGEALEQKV